MVSIPKISGNWIRCFGARRRRKLLSAYSLLEVQVAMILLTGSLLGLSAMLKVHSRQMEAAESWCRDGIDYYVVSQSNTWMRRFGVAAELTTEPGTSAWEPPVLDEQNYEVKLDSFVLDHDAQTASARVKLKQTSTPTLRSRSDRDVRPGPGRGINR